MVKHIFAGGITFGAGVVLGMCVGTLYGSALETSEKYEKRAKI